MATAPARPPRVSHGPGRAQGTGHTRACSLEAQRDVCGAHLLGLSPLAAAWTQLCTHWALGWPRHPWSLSHICLPGDLRAQSRTGRKHRLLDSWEIGYVLGRETAEVTFFMPVKVGCLEKSP